MGSNGPVLWIGSRWISAALVWTLLAAGAVVREPETDASATATLELER